MIEAQRSPAAGRVASRARRLLVIFNPAAGGRRRRRFERVLRALGESGAALTIHETRGAGDAEAAARALDPARVDAVIAAGGDGTINEVLNGLSGADLPLGILPLGTANVLAAELGLPRGARGLARILAEGRPAPMFPGSANGRRFAMMAGIGFDARVVEALDPRLKRWAGKAAYLASALTALARHRAGHYAVEIDGAPYEAAAVLIAKGHFYAGRYVVAARARLDEPALEVALFGGARRYDIVRYAAALGANRIAALADVRVLRARSVRVLGPAGERVQLDGDLGPALPLIATVAADPIALLRP